MKTSQQQDRGVEKWSSRRAHNSQIAGSSPAPATNSETRASNRSNLDRLAYKVESVRRIGDAYLVESWSRPGTFHKVNPAQVVCSCPGFLTARRNGNPCIDLRAVYTCIAQSILEIEGSPDAETFRDAIAQIERGGGMLHTRYYSPGHATRYGYAPNRVSPVQWSIGLTEEARGRELSIAERRACLFVLGTLLSEAEAEESRAA